MSEKKKSKKTLKQFITFIAGVIFIITGISIIVFYGIRKVYHEYQKQKLIEDNPVIAISDINIKAPILEGTDNKTLSQAAGHFIDTGDFGKGNYCVAGHNSTIYKEYFNNLKKVKTGMKISLYDKDKNEYKYIVSDTFIVEPDKTWILNDFGDDRITVITCTDDGKQRQVVGGLLSD